MNDVFVQVAYLVASALFILALKWMSAPSTARRGVIAGEIGMLLAVIGTLLKPEVEHYRWIVIAMGIGAAIGIPMAMMPVMLAWVSTLSRLSLVRKIPGLMITPTMIKTMITIGSTSS